MDERKILVVNLSRGLVGEDNASLLGALLVTKIQLAAMSRADIPADQRSPFYLYVDEFQNFATDSFATILSEARKYGLNLTVANQYIAQMPIEVKDAVFGNVGSIISFRMSADDARTMQRYYEPQFTEYDLVHMHNRHFVISMTIEGEKVPGFSAISLTLPPDQEDYSDHIIQRSRASYGVSREFVDRYVHERYLTDAPKGANQQLRQQTSATAQKPRSQEQKPRPAPQVSAQNPVSRPSQPVTPPVEIPSKEPATPPAQTASRPARPELSVPPATELAAGDEPAKPKRKRTRKRKKKPSEQSTAPAASPPVRDTEKPAPQATAKRAAPSPRPNPERPLSGEIVSGNGTIHLK
jgi:hypothetical protein